jgi:hypothetical protein
MAMTAVEIAISGLLIASTEVEGSGNGFQNITTRVSNNIMDA